MILRNATNTLETLASTFKVLALTGPRQSGKTTLLRNFFHQKQYVSLENPDEKAFALQDPRGFLRQFPDGAILDEVQRTPELFSYLQQIVDEDPRKCTFVLSGSNNFLLQQSISQSLAGRVGYLELLPFDLTESELAAPKTTNEHLFLGGYPSIVYEKSDPNLWFSAYIRTYIERDVRQLKNINDLALFQKFLYLCAGRVGQQINLSQLGNETGLDHKTVAAWLSILEASYVIHFVQPYYKNFNKRITKAPKLYFTDTGLCAFLLGIKKIEDLNYHSYRGALFENLVINELLKNRFNAAQRSNLYYFRDSSGYEIDVIIDDGTELKAIEIKSGATISGDYFKNLHFWKKLTGYSDCTVLYDGDKTAVQHGDFMVKNWKTVRNL